MNQSLTELIRVIPDFPKPGILFKDVTPLIADPIAFKICCDEFANIATKVDFVAGIEARGFIFGAAVAVISGKGFIPIRKSGKLPGETLSVQYDLEYGHSSLEIHKDLIAGGAQVLVIDDVLATGGTACAAIDLLLMANLQPVFAAFLLEIPSLGGKSRIANTHPQIQIQTLLAE